MHVKKTYPHYRPRRPAGKVDARVHIFAAMVLGRSWVASPILGLLCPWGNTIIYFTGGWVDSRTRLNAKEWRKICSLRHVGRNSGHPVHSPLRSRGNIVASPSGSGYDPRPDQFYWLSFFRGFSSTVIQVSGKRGSHPSPDIIGHHNHQKSFIADTNDLRCWHALKVISSVFCPWAGPSLQNSGTKAAILPKGRASIANSGT